MRLKARTEIYSLSSKRNTLVPGHGKNRINDYCRI